MPFTTAPVMTKAQLQSLNDDIRERNHTITLKDAERIDSFVISLYRKVLDVAENTKETKTINKVYNEYVHFYSEHLQEILYGLKQHLPDSKIESKVLVYNSNGILCESNNLSFYEQKMNTYIVIDWS